MKTELKKSLFFPASFLLMGLFFISGCGNLGEGISDVLYPELAEQRERAAKQQKKTPGKPDSTEDYYEKFYMEITRKARIKPGTSEIKALDSLPKDEEGKVNWTAAVVGGYISPRGSLDPKVEDDPPLNLNVFIEAKVPLMANVLFPHSIHTYWLSCNVCHPKIFIPEAGVNPMSMEEIWKGEWCGRCHGKVAFSPFMPRGNCTRCHVVLKGQSLEQEHWR